MNAKIFKAFAFAAAGTVALSPIAAMAAPVTLVATLSGAAETSPGDPDGSGQFSVEIDADTGDFCYTLTGKALDQVMAAHVHTGAAGVDGPPVVNLEMTSDECIAVEPAVLKPIVENPAGYYVNIHTGPFPKGAVRGQLAKK